MVKVRGSGPQTSMAGRLCRLYDTFMSFPGRWRRGRRDSRVYADQRPAGDGGGEQQTRADSEGQGPGAGGGRRQGRGCAMGGQSEAGRGDGGEDSEAAVSQRNDRNVSCGGWCVLSSSSGGPDSGQEGIHMATIAADDGTSSARREGAYSGLPNKLVRAASLDPRRSACGPRRQVRHWCSRDRPAPTPRARPLSGAPRCGRRAPGRERRPRPCR